MTDRAAIRESLQPWAGAFFGPALWYAHQQGLGVLVYFNCRAAGPVSVLLASVVAIGGVVAAGWWSSLVWRRRQSPPDFDVRRFIGLGSVLAAGVFTLALIFQTMAGLIVPGCAR